MLLLLGLGLQWHHEALLALKSGDHDLQALGKQTTCVAFFIRPIKAFGVKTNMLALGLLLLEALLLLWHGSMQRHEVLLHKSNDFMAPESLTYAMVESAYELSCNVASHCPLRWILNGGSGSSI